MRKLFVLLLLVIMAGFLFSATIDVSKPYKLTNNTEYERGNDIAFCNGYYWLVFGKSTTCSTEYDQAWGNDGNPDHQDYHIYYKKATSISGLASASEVQLMYDSAPAMTNPSLGEAWIEYYDNKIFIAGTETNVAAGKNVKMFWSDDDGTTWNKLDDILGGNTYAQHVDMEIYNDELYFVWGAYTCHLSDPSNQSAWNTAVANKSTISSSSGTARLFADKTDPNPANHVLYLACLNNAWNGGLVFTYTLSTDSWDSGYTIEYAAYDPVLTKYDDSFIFLQAPWLAPQQGYLYCYTETVSEFTANNFRVFDPSAYNADTIVGDNDNEWACFWGQAMVDLYGASPSENTVVVYCSERNDTNPLQPRNADIYCMEMNWGLGNNHFTFIGTAIYGAYIDQNNAASICFDPAADNDIINVISGTYVEDVIIAADLFIYGNQVSIIDGDIDVNDTGTAREIDPSNVVINDFWITGTLSNNGTGTVDARYNYWGSADGPGASIVGAVDYIPWYTDAEMTTLAYPSPTAALAYDGSDATITWSALNDVGVTYKVYYTSDPGGSWTDDGFQTSPYVDATTDAHKFYKLVAVTDGTEWNEGAAELGYFTHVLNKMDAGHGYNFISLCLDYNVSSVSELGTAIGISSGETITLWGAADQAWTTCTYAGSSWDQDPEIDTGMAVLVEVMSDKTVYLTGSLPEDWATFDLITTATTDMNMVFLPLNMASLTDLEDVGSDIGVANCNSISLWDAANQGWTTASYLETWTYWLNGELTIEVGDVMMIGALQNFTWPD
ncbi:MAG: hypothetical protein K9M99_11855 [Candidatus Cloacimonetes bacterium]|nr:hypothetical protein [Candidatus Cloacimonadota bacterium]